MATLCKGIAIVGLGVRIPGAHNVEEFWNNLLDGKDCIKKPPLDRGSIEKEGGYINACLNEFDNEFFNMSTEDAALLNAEQRLLLEVIWESLEDAGFRPSTLKNTNTAVFLGTSSEDAAGQISRFFGLSGTALTVESSCASGAVAIHKACQMLQSGHCDLAIAGGVSIISENSTSQFPDSAISNRCKTFDEGADGFVVSEGCGVFLLKRRDEAIRDRDHVLGIIRGSALNEDLGQNTGARIPSIDAQAKTILMALKDAGAEPDDIRVLEVHGTGTPTEDIQEIQGITQVFEASSSTRKHPLILASTKTNIGHTLDVSGILGLIKVFHCLKYRTVPRILHFQSLNPEINLQKMNAVIPIKNMAFTKVGSKILLAGLNAFDQYGTIVHFIMEEPPVLSRCPSTVSKDFQYQLLTISAKSAQALETLCQSYMIAIKNPAFSLHDFAASIRTTRELFPYRISVVTNSKLIFNQKMSQKKYVQGIVHDKEINAGRSKICFLFTGSDVQFTTPGKSLYYTSTLFRDSLDACGKIFKSKFNLDLKKILWTDQTSTNGDDPHEYVRESALFCVQYALLQLWTNRFGIKPDIVLGHGFGEFAAAVAAGIFTFEDAFRLICTRSELIKGLPNVAKSLISASNENINEILQRAPELTINILAINSKTQRIVSGTIENIAQLEVRCTAEVVKFKRLCSTRALNSQSTNSIMADFEQELSNTCIQKPKCIYISSTTGEIVEECDGAYWSEQLRSTIQFPKAVEAVLKKDLSCKYFIEIGPDPELSNLVKENGAFEIVSQLVFCPSLQRSESDDWASILGSLATLSVTWNGNIDWRGLETGSFQRATLPYYPFQRSKVQTTTEREPESLVGVEIASKAAFPTCS